MHVKLEIGRDKLTHRLDYLLEKIRNGVYTKRDVEEANDLAKAEKWLSQ